MHGNCQSPPLNGQTETGWADPALIEPAVLKIKALAGMLKDLHEAIEEIEDHTNQSVAHPWQPVERRPEKESTQPHEERETGRWGAPEIIIRL